HYHIHSGLAVKSTAPEDRSGRAPRLRGNRSSLSVPASLSNRLTRWGCPRSPGPRPAPRTGVLAVGGGSSLLGVEPALPALLSTAWGEQVTTYAEVEVPANHGRIPGVSAEMLPRSSVLMPGRGPIGVRARPAQRRRAPPARRR